MQANTIDAVLGALEAFIADARRTGDRRGYFATLYWHVTRRVKAGLARGDFRDPKRLERLDVVFANRYLAALAGDATKSWRVALGGDGDPVPIVVQHLLVACNAHIDLDLGIAVAAVVPPADLPAF